MNALSNFLFYFKETNVDVTIENEALNIKEQLQETKYNITTMREKQKKIFDINKLRKTIKIAFKEVLFIKTVTNYKRYILFNLFI